jgi:hypothetical protein
LAVVNSSLGTIRPAWLWAVAATMMFILQLPMLAAVPWAPREIVSDFFQDWASARNLLNGLPIYTEHTETIPRYVGAVDPICYRNLVNAHPPTSVLLYLPVAPLDYRSALLAWNLAGLAMLAASLGIVRRELRLPVPWWSVLAATGLLLLSGPLVRQLIHGQLNLVLLLLITLAWAAERSGGSARAGALIGAATAIKLFPGFLFLYFLVRRQWSALIAGALTLAVLSGLTAALLGPEVFTTYVRDIQPRLASFGSSWYNASLVGFWTRLFDPATNEERVEPLWRSAGAARIGILLAWLAVAAVVARAASRARTRTTLDHAFGAGVTGMLLLAPITWDHAFLLLLLPVSMLWVDPPRSELAKVLLMLAVAALWFWQKPACDWVISGGAGEGIAHYHHTLTILSYPCYALLVILILGVARAGAQAPRSGT